MPVITHPRREEQMLSKGPQLEPVLGTAELVEGAQAGEQRAWSEIVRGLGPRVQGYARGKGISDSEDVVQDVFLAAARRIGEFEGDWPSFRSWIFSIAYRQIVNRYRSRSRVEADVPPDLVDPDQSAPDQLAVDSYTASEAVAALDALSDVERDVVLLRVIAGFDTDEVAAAVGKRPGNVRVIQSRALGKLREELERRGYGGEEKSDR